MAKYTKKEIADSMAYLKSIIKPTTKIFVVQQSVSSSGMSRQLDLYVYDHRYKRMQRITYDVARVLEWSMRNDCLIVTGCGMDMHFHTVYTLSGVLFPRGSKRFTGNGGGGVGCLDWQSL